MRCLPESGGRLDHVGRESCSGDRILPLVREVGPIGLGVEALTDKNQDALILRRSNQSARRLDYPVEPWKQIRELEAATVPIVVVLTDPLVLEAHRRKPRPDHNDADAEVSGVVDAFREDPALHGENRTRAPAQRTR